MTRWLDILRKFDWIMILAMILLVVFGLAAIMSVAVSSAEPDYTFVRKQVVFAVIGLAAMVGMGLMDYRVFREYSRLLYVVAAILLVLVLFLGSTIRGTTGWFDLGFVSFQPVELVKLILIVVLAKYLATWGREFARLRYVLLSGVGTALLVFLVLLQPDLGSAVVLVGVWAGLVLVTGVRKLHLGLLAIGFVALALCAWFFLLADYQKARLQSFMDPGADPLGQGYNVTQSVIAVGSGQVYGRGLASGSQSQLRFLPEAQTDFVFSVLAEELGFVGAMLILAFFAVLLYRAVLLAKSARDDFTLFLIIGIAIALFVPMFVNVGVAVGLLPVTGIALPFVSYGGSSLLMSMFMVGILQSVKARL